MEFKAGDRVRVLRLNTNEVDFYATLKDYNDGHPFILSDCSDGRFECCSVFKPNTGEVGLNRWDYYVLATDEEDTEEPEVQYTEERRDMLMEFKEGDRVRVLRYKGEYVDFYGRISEVSSQYYFLGCCTVSTFKLPIVLLKPNNRFFGPDKTDYYVLVEDEEDTETPVVQHTTDPVNHPDHYNYGEIEIIDFIERVTQHYNSDVAYHIGNAIKYLARSPHKNGKEDIEKARWYIERAYQKWSD